MVAPIFKLTKKGLSAINKAKYSVVEPETVKEKAPDWKDYAGKAQVYLDRERFKGTPLTGSILADSAKSTFEKTGKLIPLNLALAQGQFESEMGLKGRSPVNNPFNVGEFDKGTEITFNSTQEGVQAYYDLLANDYIGDNGVDPLLSNFVNKNGNRYASDLEYESKIKKQIDYINRYIDKNYKADEGGVGGGGGSGNMEVDKENRLANELARKEAIRKQGLSSFLKEGEKQWDQAIGDLLYNADRPFGSFRAILAGNSPVEGFKKPETQPPAVDSVIKSGFSKRMGIDDTDVVGQTLVNGLTGYILDLAGIHIIFGLAPRAVDKTTGIIKSKYTEAQSKSLSAFSKAIEDEMVISGVPEEMAKPSSEILTSKMWSRRGALDRTPNQIDKATKLLTDNKGKIGEFVKSEVAKAKANSESQGFKPEIFKKVIKQADLTETIKPAQVSSNIEPPLPAETLPIQPTVENIHQPTIEQPKEVNLPSREKLIFQIKTAQNLKGMPKAQVKDIAKNLTGSTGLGKLNQEQLSNILTEIKETRPRRIQGKRVITQVTEDRIKTLKDNLISRDEMTEENYSNILKGLGIKEPFYSNKGKFITESKGKEVIKGMLNLVPVIKDSIKVETSFYNNPLIGKEVERLDISFKDKYGNKPTKVNPLLDMHHYADSMEKQTGIPFGRQQEKINEKRLELDTQVIAPLVEEVITIPSYKKIVNDKKSLDRINDLVAYKLPDYVKGKPNKPINYTEDEEKIANIISYRLKGFEDDVRYNRFHEWYENKQDIPNAPEEELERASEILETQGDEALREFLNGRSWGVIRSGYDIGQVLKPKIRTYKGKPGVPKGHLKSRESVNFQRYEKDIVKRYFSYVRQMTYKTELAREIKAFQQLWDNNRDLFAEPDKVADNLSKYLSTVLGQVERREVLEQFLFSVYSQASRAVFLDVRKGVRNLFQNLAFYSSPEDFLRMDKLSPEDLKYFKTYVSQQKGIRRDLMMLGEKGLPGFRWLDTWADKINIMGLTDEINRMVSFKAKLNAVRDALKLYPNYANDDKELINLMNRAGFSDIEPVERKRALEILSTKGGDDMARYIAKAITQKVHFLYERAQRSPAEQGTSLRIILSNLLTFKKGYLQRQALDIRKLSPSEKKVAGEVKTGKRSLRSIWGSIVGGAIVGAIYKKLTGDKRNPYSAIEITKGIGIGGLATGVQEDLNDFVSDIFSAATGDRDSLGKVISSIPRIADEFIPFYNDAMNIIESLSGTYNLDTAVLRQIRAEFDKEYSPKKIKEYELDRTAPQAIQKAVFGTDRAREEGASNLTVKKGVINGSAGRRYKERIKRLRKRRQSMRR